MKIARIRSQDRIFLEKMFLIFLFFQISRGGNRKIRGKSKNLHAPPARGHSLFLLLSTPKRTLRMTSLIGYPTGNHQKLTLEMGKKWQENRMKLEGGLGLENSSTSQKTV